MTTPLTDLLWQAEKRTGLQGGKDISSAIHTARDHVADRPTAPLNHTPHGFNTAPTA